MIAPDGKLMYVLTIDIADGVVQTVRSVISPEKLRHLGPLADVRALLRARYTLVSKSVSGRGIRSSGSASTSSRA